MRNVLKSHEQVQDLVNSCTNRKAFGTVKEMEEFALLTISYVWYFVCWVFVLCWAACSLCCFSDDHYYQYILQFNLYLLKNKNKNKKMPNLDGRELGYSKND